MPEDTLDRFDGLSVEFQGPEMVELGAIRWLSFGRGRRHRFGRSRCRCWRPLNRRDGSGDARPTALLALASNLFKKLADVRRGNVDADSWILHASRDLLEIVALGTLLDDLRFDRPN